jgi:hypothetical protein
MENTKSATERLAEWKAKMAKAVVEVEAEHVAKVDAIIDARYPSSRRQYCQTCKGMFCICCGKGAGSEGAR